MAQQVDYSYIPETGGGKFLNLKSKGDKVTIRLADKPITYYVHWVDGKPSVCDDPKTCPVCFELDTLSANDAKKRENVQKKRRQTFIWPVIDRADGEAKVFKGGISIFLAIGELARDPEWGGKDQDATKFDLTITRTETSLQNFYSVIGSPTSIGKDLTKEEKQSIEKLGNLIDSVVTGASAASLADEAVVDEIPTEKGKEDVEDDFIAGLEADSKKS